MIFVFFFFNYFIDYRKLYYKLILIFCIIFSDSNIIISLKFIKYYINYKLKLYNNKIQIIIVAYDAPIPIEKKKTRFMIFAWKLNKINIII